MLQLWNELKAGNVKIEHAFERAKPEKTKKYWPRTKCTMPNRQRKMLWYVGNKMPGAGFFNFCGVPIRPTFFSNISISSKISIRYSLLFSVSISVVWWDTLIIVFSVKSFEVWRIRSPRTQKSSRYNPPEIFFSSVASSEKIKGKSIKKHQWLKVCTNKRIK